MRIAAHRGIARALFMEAGRTLVVLRVFMKKTQKTPVRELALARQRLKGVTEWPESD